LNDHASSTPGRHPQHAFARHGGQRCVTSGAGVLVPTNLKQVSFHLDLRALAEWLIDEMALIETPRIFSSLA
jgi:hypothetical protein